MSSSSNKTTKLSFSLKTKKASATNNTTSAAASGFEEDAEHAPAHRGINPGVPLVIPVQKDGRQSLQEQARQRREEQQQEQNDGNNDDDNAAIAALEAEASGDGKQQSSNNNSSNKNMVIKGADNTFQKPSSNNNTDNNMDQEQFLHEIEQLAPEVSVKSEVYRQVPIADFGAAMLRGMGWEGSVDTSDKDTSTMPRPSRLGLGATPKLMDAVAAPTHGRMRRQDQVKKQDQLRQQQEEYEKKRLQLIKLDKQQTIQVGSLVRVENRKRRAMIRQRNGVPGLNMVLVQFEGDRDGTKVKKGTVALLSRPELEGMPRFDEGGYDASRSRTGTEYLGLDNCNGDKRKKTRKVDGRNRQEGSEDKQDRDRRIHKHRTTGEDKPAKDQKRHNDSSRDDDGSRGGEKRRRKEDDHRSREGHSRSRKHNRATETTWSIPNIRVRVVTTKLGKSYYKEKGVVVDTSATGTATLKMDNGIVLEVPERYLETALPKVGGSACILAGKRKRAKGRLLERDTTANKGSIQVFQDMDIVTTSLDDMAEWCGPLDDDLGE